MSKTESHSLWPGQIRAGIQSPLAILQVQALALERQTSGVLTAEVLKKKDGGDRVELSFNIVVPALDGFRHRVMNVAHAENQPYPALISAEIFRGYVAFYDNFLTDGTVLAKTPNRADTEEEFRNIIAQVFTSTNVVTTAQGLIARATDLQPSV